MEKKFYNIINITSLIYKILLIINFFVFTFFIIDYYFEFFLNLNMYDYIIHFLILVFVNLFFITFNLSIKETTNNLYFDYKNYNHILKDLELKHVSNPKISLKSLRHTDIFNDSNLNKESIFNILNQFKLTKSGKESNIYFLNSYQKNKETFSGFIFEINYGYKLNKNFKLIVNKENFNNKSFLGDFEFNIDNENLENELIKILDYFFLELDIEEIEIVINGSYLFFVINKFFIENKECKEDILNKINNHINKLFNVI